MMMRGKIKLGEAREKAERNKKILVEGAEEKGEEGEEATEDQEETEGQKEVPPVEQEEPQKIKLRPKAKKPLVYTSTEPPKQEEEKQESTLELPTFLRSKDKDKPVRITTYIEEGVHDNLKRLNEEKRIKSITAFINAAVKECLKKYNLHDW
jgi:hypothetical protein